MLPNARVRRGGSTAKRWYETINTVNLNYTTEELRINFSMSSKGGGDTDVQVEISPKDFPAIIEAMCAVNRQETLEAMSIEMTKQLASASARYKAFERKGELRILREARAKYRSKPRDKNENERMIYNAIEAIVYQTE
jgi:hypothetical protein